MGKTHYIIPVAVEAYNPNLRKAIETVHTHTDYQIVLIGHNPGLKETHIETVQGRNKFDNTDLAIRTAVQTDWISDPFIWAADDIFWMRPATPIKWAIGKLTDDKRRNIYGQRKQQTAETLKQHGFTTWDYESHVPIPIHKQQILWPFTLQGSIRSLYGNTTGQPDIVTPDPKLRYSHQPIPNTAWVSVEPNYLQLPKLIKQLA